MTEVNISSLYKSFGSVEVLEGLNLDIKSGEFLVLLGPSGCGKSTLLRIIAGLEDETSGDIKLGGKSVTHLPPAKRGIAMVFQSYALYPHLSVRGNMALVLKQAGLNKEEIERRVAESSRALELDPLLDRKPAELSGGQRQRVAIGRAIVRDPKVFLFDEPLSNLDAALRGQVRMEIARLHLRLKDATMVYVTHDQIEAMTLADRIVVLRDGIIEQAGPPMELYNNPENQFVAGFLGAPSMNFLPAERLGKKAKTAGIRPEHIRIGKTGQLAARVTHVEHLGGDTNVLVVLETGEAMTIRLFGQHDHNSGDQVHLEFSDADCYLFDAEGGRVA